MIKAIETRAFGYRFRSRLEARWASFFTRLGLSWEYEPEGYDLGGVPYLPDFRVWTPQKKECWYEVKPLCTSTDAKFDLFANTLRGRSPANHCDDTRAMLLNGTPAQFIEKRYAAVCPRCGFLLVDGYWNHGTYSYLRGEVGMIICCDQCDTETPFGGGHPIKTDGIIPYRPSKGSLECAHRYWDGLWDFTREAATASTTERFYR